MASEIQATTVRVTNLKASDGTAGITVANSTGRVTVTETNPTITLGSNATIGGSVNLNFFQGMIASFGMSTPPTGWLACDGSAVSRSTYANLFTAIGTTWGAGDGSSTFNVPDLRGAFLRGTGTAGVSSDYVGPAIGAHQDDQNASHNHGGATGSAGARTMCAGPGGGGWNSGCINGEGRHSAGGYTNYTSAVNHTHSISSDGGTEGRPYNRGVQYCIKF